MDISTYIDTRIFCTIAIPTTVVYMYPSVDPLVSKLNVLLVKITECVVAVKIHSPAAKWRGFAAGE